MNDKVDIIVDKEIKDFYCRVLNFENLDGT